MVGRVILGTLLAIRVRAGEGGGSRKCRKWSKLRGQQNRTEKEKEFARGGSSQDNGGQNILHGTPFEETETDLLWNINSKTVRSND